MSDNSSGDAEKPIKQPGENLSKAMENLSVTPDDSDKTSTKNLSDMPLDDVVGLIIEKSDYKEQLVLRKVSEPLRALVDKQKPSCSSIRVLCMPECIFVDYDISFIIYASPKWAEGEVGCFELVASSVRVSDDFKKAAFDDLAFTLKNRKIQLEKFDFGYSDRDVIGNQNIPEMLVGKTKNYEEYYENIENVLKSLKNQVYLKELVTSLGSSLAILPYLKPGALKGIRISADENRELWDGDFPTEITEKLISLDQWKQCEKLKMDNVSGFIPIEKIDNFKQVEIYERSISSDHLMRLRDQISKINNFESLNIRYEMLNFVAFPVHICGPRAPPNDKTNFVSHYPIPNSDHYLEFLFFENSIEIVKKKKEGKKKSV